MGWAQRANPIAEAKLAGANGAALEEEQRLREFAALIASEEQLQRILDDCEPHLRAHVEARIRPFLLPFPPPPPNPFERLAEVENGPHQSAPALVDELSLEPPSLATESTAPRTRFPTLSTPRHPTSRIILTDE